METLSCQVVRVGSSPQKAGFLVLNWSLTLAKARADADSSGIYLFQILRYQVLIAQGFIYRNHQVHPHTGICLFRSLLCDRCGSIRSPSRKMRAARARSVESFESSAKLIRGSLNSPTTEY